MPNYCSNYLTLTHEDPAMIVRAKDALERGEFLAEFIPVPEELQIVAGSVGNPVEQAKLEADTNRNIEKYGYGNWYDYCVNEWGTKWDVGGDGQEVDITEDGTMLTTYFDSAWAPPTNAYEKLQDMGFGVEAMYYEPGMAFAGKWDHGSDDYYEFGSMSADQAESEIPSDVDFAFGITESIREYERENQEDLTAWVKEGIEAKKAANA
jgi:hypothetical protein